MEGGNTPFIQSEGMRASTEVSFPYRLNSKLLYLKNIILWRTYSLKQRAFALCLSNSIRQGIICFLIQIINPKVCFHSPL